MAAIYLRGIPANDPPWVREATRRTVPVFRDITGNMELDSLVRRAVNGEFDEVISDEFRWAAVVAKAGGQLREAGILLTSPGLGNPGRGAPRGNQNRRGWQSGHPRVLVERLLEMQAQGMTFQEMATEMGGTPTKGTISKILRKHREGSIVLR